MGINIKNSHSQDCRASISVTVQRTYFFLLEKSTRYMSVQALSFRQIVVIVAVEVSPQIHRRASISQLSIARQFYSADGNYAMPRLYVKIFRVSLGHCTVRPTRGHEYRSLSKYQSAGTCIQAAAVPKVQSRNVAVERVLPTKIRDRLNIKSRNCARKSGKLSTRNKMIMFRHLLPQS